MGLISRVSSRTYRSIMTQDAPKYVIFSTKTIETLAAKMNIKFNHPQLSLIIANDLTFQLRKQVEIAKRRARKQRLKRLDSFITPTTTITENSSIQALPYEISLQPEI